MTIQGSQKIKEFQEAKKIKESKKVRIINLLKKKLQYVIVGIYQQCVRIMIMTISERLFKIMEEKDISMPELSRMTGISRHTIFDWQRRNTNPGADKIMVICEALHITPEELLVGKYSGEMLNEDKSMIRDDIEFQIVEGCRELSEEKKKRLLAYVSMLQNAKK